MRFGIKLLIIALVLVLVSGCLNTFVAVKPDIRTGLFPASYSLSKDEIKAFSPIENLHDQQFTVLFSTTNEHTTWAKNYKPFVEEMVTNSGLDNFVDQVYLENLVIANDLGDRVPSLSNRIGYNQLSKYIGPYLLVTSELYFQGGDKWEFSLMVYDPVTSTPKFHAVREGYRVAGLKGSILMPVFNALKNWVEQSELLEKEENRELRT